MKFRLSLILSAALFVLFSCRTVPEKTSAETNAGPPLQEESPSPEPASSSYSLTLLFGGDIMAHRQNFGMNDFSVIWKDVSTLISSADFSFANIEAPVDDDIPYASYPEFNMHHEYPEAAINAGFNVFSIINNHSNDQNYSGMMHTYDWAQKISSLYADTPRPVYFSGLHNKKNEPVDFVVITKKNWTIIFCAVTEILNKKDYKEYMNYVPPDTHARTEFKKRIQEIKIQNPCDIFVLSIHAAVPEYVHEISSAQRKYYHELLDSGADIVWANHPHVVQEREIISKKDAESPSKLIMYANGNTISGQRREPVLDSPYGTREYTGDGLLFKVTYTKTSDSAAPVIADTQSHYVTTYIDTGYQFIIKYLDDDFIQYLKNTGRSKWSSYIMERKKIMEKTKVTKTWL
jgi:poly-gamma-glutamate capsule biosynthesis protein CapA/YwtB (metallophosphatase superfamily)